jgi:sirohydrochlorin ferrochelatase
MSDAVPRLLLVAHGTASPAGSATTARLVDDLRAARPDVVVDVCFLDVAEPRLAASLDERPTVAVPLLLSTGYHVQSDIPAAVAAHPQVRVARHLGPHALLADALIDRLGPLPAGATVALVGAGSSRPEAAAELTGMTALLGERLGRPVPALNLGQDMREALTALSRPVHVATYLLAEGQFLTNLRQAADGLAEVAAPIGNHRALVELVWQRFAESATGPLG